MNCDICGGPLGYDPDDPEKKWVCDDCWLELEAETALDELEADRTIQ